MTSHPSTSPLHPIAAPGSTALRGPRLASLVTAACLLFAGAGCAATSRGTDAAGGTADPTTRTSAAPDGAPGGADSGGAGSGGAVDEVATTATIRPGEVVPAPTGRVLLTIRGGSVTNVADELRLDRELLEGMGTVDLTVEDRFATGATATFRGPLLRTVLAVAGADDAVTLHTIALNDYIADVPAADADELPLIVATRMNGRPMSVANYGPTRFIYPTDAGLDSATYEPRWVWQLATIEIR